MIRYLEGTPIRKLATQLNIGKSTIDRKILSALKKVPNSNHISETLCDKFGSIVIVDGKYIRVAGHEKKIPMIWAIDYKTHDIVYHQLVGSENLLTYLQLFRSLKFMNYQLKKVVCDELECIAEAALTVFPNCKIQICTKHYKANIRKQIDIVNDPLDKEFFEQILLLFKSRTLKLFCSKAVHILQHFTQKKIYSSIMHNINDKIEYLTSYIGQTNHPDTSNLIELYNSHLEAKLKSIKGFKNFETAQLFLNAYVVNRRLRKFTDCSIKFKHLNGTYSLQHTLRNNSPAIKLLRNLR